MPKVNKPVVKSVALEPLLTARSRAGGAAVMMFVCGAGCAAGGGCDGCVTTVCCGAGGVTTVCARASETNTVDAKLAPKAIPRCVLIALSPRRIGSTLYAEQGWYQAAIPA